MSAALCRLAKDLNVPADDPAREQALLTLFDQARARPRSHAHASLLTGLIAAGLAFTAVVSWNFARVPAAPRRSAPAVTAIAPEAQRAAVSESGPPDAGAEPPISTSVRRGTENASRRLDEASDSMDFVTWPGAAAWPPFESGELIRVDIPTEAGVVQADVLVGQDGFARAVRLIQ